jgi:hypothetical protein
MHHYDMYHNQRSLSQRLIFNFQLVSAHKSVGISYVRFDRCGIFKIPPEFQWELLSRTTNNNNQQPMVNFSAVAADISNQN